ncbi:MAG: hypothetical protein JWM16_3231 [Verrucomicrobiales bacterium]|nr:hypothetical protein [Verrucomicrobiales bacterium]
MPRKAEALYPDIFVTGLVVARSENLNCLKDDILPDRMLRKIRLS